MDQLRISSQQHSNKTHQNHHALHTVRTQVSENIAQIRFLEQLVLDHRSLDQESYNKLLHDVIHLNRSLSKIKTNYRDHHTHASTIFEELDDKYLEFHDRIKKNDNRLMRLEVFMLNKTLNECQKSNSELHQDMKLTDYEQKISQLEKVSREYEGKIRHIDRGLYHLSKNVGEKERVMEKLMQKMENFTNKLSNFDIIQEEVSNFVHHLPPGKITQDLSILHV